jgi:hypothetical protein
VEMGFSTPLYWHRDGLVSRPKSNVLLLLTRSRPSASRLDSTAARRPLLLSEALGGKLAVRRGGVQGPTTTVPAPLLLVSFPLLPKAPLSYS